jgi:hypothetical protein
MVNRQNHPSEKADHVRDMAALLFAELFWKQSIDDHKKKQVHADTDKKFDSRLS